MVDKIKGPDFGVEPKNRRQHEHRRDHGVHEEFDGGVDLAPMAVHSDQQRHRNQGGFPEEIKHEQIERHEDADQRRLQHQQDDEEFLYPLMNRFPGDQHAQWGEKSGQHHQPHGNSVHAHVVMNVGYRNPCAIEFILKPGLGPMEVNRQMQ